MLVKSSDNDLIEVPVYWVWVVLGAALILLAVLLVYSYQAKMPTESAVPEQGETVSVSRRASLVLPADAIATSSASVGGGSSARSSLSAPPGARTAPAPSQTSASPASSGRASLVLPTP